MIDYKFYCVFDLCEVYFYDNKIEKDLRGGFFNFYFIGLFDIIGYFLDLFVDLCNGNFYIYVWFFMKIDDFLLECYL